MQIDEIAETRKRPSAAISELEIERRLGDFLRAEGVEVLDQDGESFVVTTSILDDEALAEISIAELARFVAQLFEAVP